MTKKPTIMYESPESASIQTVTVTGWVASNGRFWGNDERMARYDGSTHRQCEKNPAHPVYETGNYCRACRDEQMQAKFDALPRKEWDGDTPLVVFDDDRYFFDAESLRDYLQDEGIAPADIQLVFCVPTHAREIDPNEHFCDDLPEDGEVSAELCAAFEALNAIIRKEPPLSWSEGKVAAVLPDGFV